MFLPIVVGAAAVGLMLRSPRQETRATLEGTYSDTILPERTIVVMGPRCPVGYYQIGTISVLGADGIAYQGHFCAPIHYRNQNLQQRYYR